MDEKLPPTWEDEVVDKMARAIREYKRGPEPKRIVIREIYHLARRLSNPSGARI